MPVEQVINIQEETGIFICLIGKVQVSEELALERFVRRVVTNTFPQISKLKSACQLAGSVNDAAVPLHFAVIIMPVPYCTAGLPFLLLRMPESQSRVVGQVFIFISCPFQFNTGISYIFIGIFDISHYTCADFCFQAVLDFVVECGQAPG